MSTTRFEGLTRRQTEVLALIATNFDKGHDPRVTRSLKEKGYILKTRDGYIVPYHIHIRWCSWCASLPEEALQE